MANHDIDLMAHLLRRAGFGSDRDELEARAAKSYDVTLDELLDPLDQRGVDEDLLFRLHPALYIPNSIESSVHDWVYRMLNNPRQLQEKMSLFWHTIFCAGHSKIDDGLEIGVMIGMFREYGMGNFRDLLYRLSVNPGMLYYLDNTESHGVALNENYGRELLELFSMGVGMDEEMNYTEDDVKACARAFTGWNVAPAHPVFPHGRSQWQFRFDPADHDDGEKTFLGETGRWNGDDILDIICRQPATARFISRHMCNFFVADEPPVPSWRLTPPLDVQLVQTLERAYFESEYDITAMLRALFTSEAFKSDSLMYSKVKSPAEMVVGALRLAGEHREIKPGLFEISLEPKYMGMDLMNPPTVEGWHTGREWIDNGTLVERINFASDLLGNTELPGVRSMVDRLKALGPMLTPEVLVNGCLDVVGPLPVHDETRKELLAHACRGGEARHGSSAEDAEFTRRAGEMFQMIASSAEYQFG